jgi:acyl-CoA hydrolase
LSTFSNEYTQKLVSAEKAVQAVKSGDWVAYSHFVMFPETLDRALAQRVGELTDVKVKTSTGMRKAQVAELDPEQKSFLYHSSFFSHADRQLADKGLCFYLPGNYGQETVSLFQGKADAANVVMLKTTAMDENGFFNFGTSASFAGALVDKADIVIVEVNTTVPRCLGGVNENVHISKVDFIVESDNYPMMALPVAEASEEQQKIAAFIVSKIEDGCCLQLGIGAIPNMVGKYIADSDVKDLGCHSEMLADAYVDLYEKGKITGANKTLDKGKMVYTFAMGSQKLYDFMDNNPVCATYDVGYTNYIPNIAANDKVFGVNNALEVDLFGQACAESQGNRHISGAGACLSKGGKAFICINSTRVRGGKLMSRIVPGLHGVVTTPRTWNMNVVTEYGIAKIKGKSTYEIAENLIAIAHPQFQDELVKEAQQLNIWTKTNKMV